MSTSLGKKEVREGEKKEKKEPEASPEDISLKTTTKTSQVFFLPNNFNRQNVSCEEPFPKNFNDFDQIISKVIVNLEETENVFLNQAKAVLDRDLTLIEWRLRLKALYEMLKRSKEDFERIDQTVECILKLSYHIDNILCKLEKELPEHSLISNALKFSPIRMTMYNAMLKISLNQRDMMQQLSSTVLSINEAIDCNPSDPVDQFTRILNLHLEVLKTIEMKAELVAEQLKTATVPRRYCGGGKKPIACEYYF